MGRIAFVAAAIVAFGVEATPSLAAGTDITFVPTGGTATLSLNAIQGRTFDPRNHGAIATGVTTSIGSLYPNATVESLAAQTSPAGGTPFAFLTDPRAGLKFTLTLTSVTDSQHLVFTATQPGGNGSPGVAGVPQFTFDPLHLSKEVFAGMVVTDLTKSGATTGLTVSSVVPWPVFGETQPSGSPGTVVLSGAETGMAAGDTIQFEVPASILDANYTLDWLGTFAAVHAADANPGGGAVSLGPGTYEMGTGPIWTWGDNPVAIVGAGPRMTGLFWNTAAPIGGVYLGDEIGNVNTRMYSQFRNFLIAHTISSTSFGVAPDTGIDVLLGQNSTAEGVTGNGGYATIGLLGDHNTLKEINAATDFYGAFVMPFNQTNGNVAISNSNLQGFEASLGISYNGTFNDNYVTFGEWGVSPHLIYKETNFNSLIPASAVSASCITNTKIDWLASENIGGTPIECNGGSMIGNAFLYFSPGMNSNTSLDIPTENANYFIHTTGTFSRNSFSMSDPQINAGSWAKVAWIDAGSFGPNDLGDMSNTVLFTGVPLLLSGNASSVDGITLDDRTFKNAAGSAEGGYQHLVAVQNYDASGVALTSGQIVTVGQYGFAEVSRPTSAGQQWVGVVVQGCAWGTDCLIADAGIAEVSHETSTGTTATPGASVYVYSGAASQATVSTTAGNQGALLGPLSNVMSAGSDPQVLVHLR